MNHETLRQRVNASGLTQQAIATAVGIDRSLLSRLLGGHRGVSEDLRERIEHAIDRLERAEQAASEARAKVMAELYDDEGST